MTSEEGNMERSSSSQKRRRNPRHNQDVEQTFKMRKTYSKDERMLADTYCQTVTMQLKIEENGSEHLINSKYFQTETANSNNQPGRICSNTTLVHSTELGDPPLLRQPQQTTMTGIQQIIECFRSGTVQAKLTLLKEVDTIFECQLCRSLFRCLPNLLEHRRFYCLSRQPEPDDPSQAMKDLLEAVFPQRNWEGTSPVRTMPSPVHQDHSNSHQQNSVPQKLCYREPVVVLRRFHQPPAAPDKVGPVSHEAVGIELVEMNDGGEEGSLSNVQDTITSAKLEQPEYDLEWDTVSQSNLKEQHSSCHRAVHVKLGGAGRRKENTENAPTLKKIFCCRLCRRMFMSHRTLTRHMNIDHNTRILLKDSASKAKIKSTSGHMEENGEGCKEPFSSVGKKFRVCQTSLKKEENVHRLCNEVRHGLNAAKQQDCATPAAHLSNQTTPVTQPSSKPVKKSPSSQEAAHFSKEGSILWMKDLFCCGLCKAKYSSQVLLMKHMSTAHKFFVLEDCSAASRTPPPRKVKTKLEPADKAFDNVRVYCWLCGKNFYSRRRVRKHCHKDHRQKLQEIDMLMNEGTGPESLAHEPLSLENGFVASQTPPTPSLPAR